MDRGVTFDFLKDIFEARIFWAMKTNAFEDLKALVLSWWIV